MMTKLPPLSALLMIMSSLQVNSCRAFLSSCVRLSLAKCFVGSKSSMKLQIKLISGLLVKIGLFDLLRCSEMSSISLSAKTSRIFALRVKSLMLL